MATSHGVIQGYNTQAVVDAKRQVVVHAEALGEGQDASAMAPMLAGAERNLKAAGVAEAPLKGAQVSADTVWCTTSRRFSISEPVSPRPSRRGGRNPTNRHPANPPTPSATRLGPTCHATPGIAPVASIQMNT